MGKILNLINHEMRRYRLTFTVLAIVQNLIANIVEVEDLLL